MAEEALLESQVTYLYNASAKELYSLALHSVGDRQLAEQYAIDAFVFAFNHLKDKSDVSQFRLKSARHLYLISKKTFISRSWHSTQKANPFESIVFAVDEGKHRVRYVVLLKALLDKTGNICRAV